MIEICNSRTEDFFWFFYFFCIFVTFLRVPICLSCISFAVHFKTWNNFTNQQTTIRCKWWLCCVYCCIVCILLYQLTHERIPVWHSPNGRQKWSNYFISVCVCVVCMYVLCVYSVLYTICMKSDIYMSKDFSNEKSTTTTTVTTYSASNRAVWLLFMLAYVDLFYVETLKHTMLNRENYSTQTKRHTILKWYKTLKRLNPIIFCFYFLGSYSILRQCVVLFL